MANPNLASASSIFGRTDVLAATTTATAITSNAAASGKVLKVNTLTLSNKSAANVDATVDVFRGATAYKIAHAVSVPVGATLVVLAKENPMYLNEGDSLRVAASAASALDAVCSYEELS